MNFAAYKPNLAPNNPIGKDINWAERLNGPFFAKSDIEEWYVSEKLDGIRLELFFKDGICQIKSRSLKRFNSKLLLEYEECFTACKVDRDCVVDAEIYCVGMSFSELQHFILSDDVENPKNFNKLRKEMADGKFEGRSFEWLTSYEHNFRIYFFDCDTGTNQTFEARNAFDLIPIYKQINRHWPTVVALVTQRTFEQFAGIENFYEYIVDECGGEGIILKHRKHMYKHNRNTLKEGTYFKWKDDAIKWTGTILDVLEGTVVDEWAETTTNELGRSVTSKSKFDREPSGKAKGFHVIMDDGRELTVTLAGFTDHDKVKLLVERKDWIGQQIVFVGMNPTKVNGVPRQAKYQKQ